MGKSSESITKEGEAPVREAPGMVVNPCKACAPLGASIALRGIRNSMCILHGSQGCATYIRRFLIGHFREPVDIASSSFDESSAVFGGRSNLIRGVKNIIGQYKPEVIGIATTCLAETIGEDVGMYLKDFPADEGVTYIHTETAAYKGTHVDGFMKMCAAIAAQAAPPRKRAAAGAHTCGQGEVGKGSLRINLFPWMVSPEDIRHLKWVLGEMGVQATLLPDYSRSFDGGAWKEYHRLPEGGTSIDAVRRMGEAEHSIEFGLISSHKCSPAAIVKQKAGVPYTNLPLPIGLKNSDACINALIDVSRENGHEPRFSPMLKDQRERLLDAYADAHKYFAGLRAAVYGEGDFVAGICSLLCELGIEPVICLSGEKLNSHAEAMISRICTDFAFDEPLIRFDADFSGLEAILDEVHADLMIGGSKGYKVSRRLGIPLVRAGFPIQDRLGGQRLLHIGYAGALRMTDQIANTMIAKRQDESPVGYMSM
ncbi:nitrogenase component 1 [Sediminispirochaeta smaragdinae]|uniref:Nitrogenase n=1 Tax=Sediminispirochaeta smaragdinae (strain DSM 11293 / JCM 15392 / SEBR 4228) TaxID=573413 RepID=E1R3Y3_SEDSS|nr:nitrogenase component 1 [Sediminispirochaeta smaragdinae]ADK82104.1 Nitrogenase [Sediminispirochaeta smaragdinae DSM 11293]